MSYDDHDYCEQCSKEGRRGGTHSRNCYCWCEANPIEREDPDDVCPGGPGHG